MIRFIENQWKKCLPIFLNCNYFKSAIFYLFYQHIFHHRFWLKNSSQKKPKALKKGSIKLRYLVMYFLSAAWLLRTKHIKMCEVWKIYVAVNFIICAMRLMLYRDHKRNTTNESRVREKGRKETLETHIKHHHTKPSCPSIVSSTVSFLQIAAQFIQNYRAVNSTR